MVSGTDTTKKLLRRASAATPADYGSSLPGMTNKDEYNHRKRPGTSYARPDENAITKIREAEEEAQYKSAFVGKTMDSFDQMREL